MSLDNLDDFDDDDIVDEVFVRGLEYRFESDLQDSLSNASDEQLIQEYKDRFRDEFLSSDLERVYQLMTNGNSYEQELKELIYNHLGRIL